MRVVLEYKDIGIDKDIPIILSQITKVERQYMSLNLENRIVIDVKNYEDLQTVLEALCPHTRWGIKIVRVGTWKDKIKKLFKKV